MLPELLLESPELGYAAMSKCLVFRAVQRVLKRGRFEW